MRCFDSRESLRSTSDKGLLLERTLIGRQNEVGFPVAFSRAQLMGGGLVATKKVYLPDGVGHLIFGPVRPND